MPAQPQPGPKLVSRADYARLHGWPQSYVSRLAKRGIVVLRLNGGRVWVDVDASDQRYGDEIRPRLRFGKDY